MDLIGPQDWSPNQASKNHKKSDPALPAPGRLPTLIHGPLNGAAATTRRAWAFLETQHHPDGTVALFIQLDPNLVMGFDLPEQRYAGA